ncbi:MAG: DUF362 domain-containing protein, partial [Candidatus Lindowbacteria bacterium]|nr:DUF362 domain-containing protein [Candidatus Lindowbacteria bacterium]
MNKYSRKGFLKSLAGVSVASWTILNGKSISVVPAFAASPAGSKVVVASRASVADNGKVNAAEVAKLLSESVVAATGKTDAKAVWKSLFGPQDTVGIKLNCLAGRGLSSHPELVTAIVDGLASAGVPKDKILVWDRTEHDVMAAGFALAGINGAKVLATDTPGVGYETDIEFSGEVGSCFSRIISRMCTAIINVPVLKDHDLAGVSLGMKNFYGAIHNPNKYHDNNCDPYVADLCAHPFIAKKLRLVICDGLKGQYHGGPAPRPQWSWPAGTLIVGRDPVAVDRIGLDIIERKRKDAGMQPLK